MREFGLRKRLKSGSVRVYAALLRLYPTGFRREYGADLKQLFADQTRDAVGLRALCRLWAPSLLDFLRSVPREHFNELNQDMSMNSLLRSSAKVSFFRWFALIALLLMTVCVAITSSQPRIYSSTARLNVSISGENDAPFDPYKMQIVFEKLTSDSVLKAVTAELKLTEQIYKQGGVGRRELGQGEIPQVLKSMITLRQSRNTSLVEVRVVHSDDVLPVLIANKIAVIFGRLHPEYNVELVDPGQTSNYPVRPNIPMNIVGGGFLSLVIAAVLAGILRLFIRLRIGPRAATPA